MHVSNDDLHDGPQASRPAQLPDLHDTHHLWLKAILLAAWVVCSFGVCFFARDLQAWVQGWQLGYWLAAQGAVLMFMLIVVVYCVVMNVFERDAGASANNSSSAPAPPHAPSPRQ